MSTTHGRPLRRPGTAVGLAAVLLGLTYGYDGTAMAGAQILVTDRFHLSPLEQGTLYAGPVVGLMAGTILAGRLSNLAGRRGALVIASVVCSLTTVVSALSVNPPMLVGTRAVLGMTMGVLIVIAPVFIAESVRTTIRGRTAVLYQCATAGGCAATYFISYLLAGGGHWRTMLVVPALCAAAATLALLRLPETPSWHLMAGRADRAAEAARLLGTPAPAAAPEDPPAAAQAKGRFLELFTPKYRRLTLFVIALGFLVQITGISAIGYFSPRIFQRMGYTGDFSLLMLPGLIQLISAVAALVCAVAIDRVSRRAALLTGTSLMTAGHLLLVGVFAAFLPPAAGLLGLAVFAIGFNAGFGALIWVFAAEGFPDRLRGPGASAMLLANLSANLLIAQFFLSTLSALGGTATFCLLLAVNVVAWFYVYLQVPDTGGRTLGEVQAYWEAGRRWSASPVVPAPQRAPDGDRS
ncbi:MFS transporter [Streptomyces similanensis]|uniref:Sugar porter family MFS transporter n=1 Tax=Streptomyces similanensis TaxID=1274988 RepID=A0ABP9LJY5_9ACTN